ncbi:hypothetical protein D9M71_125900 [compost metagenome]
MLADHRLVGLQRQHLIVATDNHWYAEVSDGQGEHQTECGEHGLTGRRPGDAAEGFCRTRAHAGGGIEQSRIGQGQGRQKNHQGVREGVDDFAKHNAPEAVDVVREQATQHALVAEQVNQRDARQHRRRHQWQQRDASPDTFGRNQGSLQRVGKQVGQRYDNGRDTEGNLQAVTEQPVEVLAGHQLFRCDPATALPGLGAETTPEDRQQRHQYGNAQQHQHEDFAADHEQPVTDLGAGGLPNLLVRQRQRDVRAHQANTCRLRGGKATMICWAPRRGMASGANSANSGCPGN